MWIKKEIPDIASSEITPEGTYMNRRRFIEIASGLSIAASTANAWAQTKKGPYDTDEKQTPYKDVTTCNNFYEFGIDKDAPARNAKNFRIQPWTISVEGLVKKPQVYALDGVRQASGVSVSSSSERLCLLTDMPIRWHRCMQEWT